MERILEEIRIFVFGKERTLIKTIINWGFILLVIAGFTEYGIDHNGDMSGLFKKETWETKPTNKITFTEKNKKKVVYLRTLGSVSPEYVRRTKKLITEKFNVDVQEIDNIEINSGMFCKEGFIGVNKVIKFLPKKGKTITLIGYKILNEDDNKKLGGFTLGLHILVSTKCSFFDKALVHEYGHSLFLDHCSNQNCVMSTNKNTGTNFCQNCKKLLSRENI